MGYMTAIVDSLRNVESLKRFIEEGGLEAAIADCSLDSGIEGLSNLHSINDKRGLIWSVVSNLRLALVGYRRSIFKKSKTKSWFIPYSHAKTFAKLQKTHCLLIVCYQYLGELGMAQKEYFELESETEMFMPLWIKSYQEETFGKVYLQNKFILPAIVRTIDQAVTFLSSNKETIYDTSEISQLKPVIKELQ